MLLLIILPISGYSQHDSDMVILDAKLWTAQGDTIKGKILYVNQFNLQLNVTLTDTSGKPVQLYSAKDLKGFIYYLDSDSVEFISMNNPTDLGRLFLRLVYRGRLLMYQFLELSMKSGMINYNVSYYLWDNEWLYPPINSKFEMESLLIHFSDCPELEYKIKAGIYGLPQIRTILSEYEKCRVTDKYEYFYE